MNAIAREIVDHRAHVGFRVGERVVDLQCAHRCDDAIAQLILLFRDAHEDRAGHAALPGVAEGAAHDGAHGGIGIGIGHDK